jgi:hypothetical protein
MPKLKGYVIQNDSKYQRAVYGSPNAHGEMTGGVGEKATEGEKLAAYDRLGGLILSGGRKIKMGTFWDFKKNKRVEKPEPIVQIRVDGELFEYPEGKELPLEVKAKETLDKRRKDKKAKEVADKKQKAEDKKDKAQK